MEFYIMATTTYLLINLRPSIIIDGANEANKAELANQEDMLKTILDEYGTELSDITGNITIRKNNTLITDEGHLVFIYPDKIWYACAFEPHEFTILAEQDREEEEETK